MVVEKLRQQLSGGGYPISIVDQLLTSIVEVQLQDATVAAVSRWNHNHHYSHHQRAMVLLVVEQFLRDNYYYNVDHFV